MQSVSGRQRVEGVGGGDWHIVRKKFEEAERTEFLLEKRNEETQYAGAE